MVNPSTLAVIVRNKDKVLYSGQAYAVTSYNDKGVFDVLPQHENFITLIKEKVIVRKTQKDEKEIKIENGIVKVYKDNIYVYVNFKSSPA